MVNDENFLHLLDDLLLEAIVDDLEVLFLNLDDLLLLVEVVEAIDEIKALAPVAIDNSPVETFAKDVVATLGVARKGLRSVDRLCNCRAVSVQSI